MTTAAPSLSTRARAWNAGLSVLPGEHDLDLPADRIEGAIPQLLRGGRLLSNGPGWSVIGGVTAHPFDGHGYVRSFAFRPDGSVRFTARFVRTPVYEEERAAGRLVRRGLATNLDGPFWRNRPFGPARNVANTTISRWNDRLLAGWEGGAPYALDPRTLETRGEELFGGALAGQATLAHTKHDARRDRLVTCSTKPGRETRFVFREFARDETLASTREVAIPGMLFSHDYALSPSYYVLGGNPLRLVPRELLGMLLGRSTLLRSIATDARAPGALHLVPRDGGPLRTVRLPEPAWVVHFGNAFERDGDLHVDACVFHRFGFGEEFGYQGPRAPFDPTLPERRGPQRLYRITVPARGDAATWRVRCPHGVDFPRFHPGHEGVDTPALFGATRADTRYSDPFDAVLRVDLRDAERPPALFTVPENAFVGEPVFVPDPARDDAGYVLALVTHALEDRTDLVVLDARALERGPVATVPLPLLPVAFHGGFDTLDA